MVLAYNPELKTPDQLPKTFKEFAEDTSLKGRISMGNPLTLRHHHGRRRHPVR